MEPVFSRHSTIPWGWLPNTGLTECKPLDGERCYDNSVLPRSTIQWLNQSLILDLLVHYTVTSNLCIIILSLTIPLINPFTPISDQDRISPYNINTISCRQVMRIYTNISQEIISWSKTKLSKLTSQEL